MLFHQSCVNRDILFPFSCFGHLGVDLFFFLSGMGIAASLQRHSLGRFYVNRLVRLFPAWVLVSLVILGKNWYAGGYSGLLSFWNVFTSFWFLNALLVLYLLSPVLVMGVRKFGMKGIVLLAICIELFMGICVAEAGPQISIPISWGLGLSRVPAFLLGIAMLTSTSGACVRRRGMNVVMVIATTLGLLWCINAFQTYVPWSSLGVRAGFLCHYIVFPLIAFAVPCVAFWLARMGTVLKPFRLYKVFLLFGILSLECYLWHCWVYLKLQYHSVSWGISGWLCLILAILLTLAASWGTHWLCARLTAPLQRKKA